MANVKNGSTLWAELLSFQSYKRNQGRVTRQVTTAGIALVALLGTISLSQGPLADVQNAAVRVGVPTALFLIGLWLAFRIVNYSQFADFLISVEAEMNKVSWPSRNELFRASIVVIVVIFFLAALLFIYDIILKAILGGFFGLGG